MVVEGGPLSAASWRTWPPATKQREAARRRALGDESQEKAKNPQPRCSHGTILTIFGEAPSIAKGGRPRLHLFAAAPPSAPAEPGSVHLRVGVTLTPAKGKHPTRSAWALEAHDIGPGGAQKERLRARGAIATAATHPAHAKGTVAKRHTWQVGYCTVPR